MSKYIIVFVIICLLVFVEWMREIHTFKVTHYFVVSPKLKGLKTEKKVVFLSDLHNCSYGAGNEKLLRAIADEDPDYILVAGDMVVGTPGASTKVASDFMAALPSMSPVYFANGNHEQRMKECTDIYGTTFFEFKEHMENAGVKCLSNETVELNWDGIPVRISGLEMGNKKFRKFRKHTFTKDKLTNSLGNVDQEKYHILIAHNPAFVDTYLEWGADLILSGHFHGGVVRLPGIGGVITPNFTMFPKYSGELTKVGEATVVVSKGIGIHTIKVRLFNPAEVVVIHINGTEE